MQDTGQPPIYWEMLSIRRQAHAVFSGWRAAGQRLFAVMPADRSAALQRAAVRSTRLWPVQTRTPAWITTRPVLVSDIERLRTRSWARKKWLKLPAARGTRSWRWRMRGLHPSHTSRWCCAASSACAARKSMVHIGRRVVAVSGPLGKIPGADAGAERGDLVCGLSQAAL